MNEEAAQRGRDLEIQSINRLLQRLADSPRHNAVLNLGTESIIYLERLANSRANDTIEQFIAALETSKSLTVNFAYYKPSPEKSRLFIEPLCRCITNLRSRNEHHPLRDLELEYADLRIHAGMLDVVQQFLVAARKYGGIYHLKLNSVRHFPIQCLVEFCRNNNNLKFLEMAGVSFSDGEAAMSLASNRTQDSSVMLALDKLCVYFVSFENSTAVTIFSYFIARMTARSMELGCVSSKLNDEITARITSEIKIPSVKQLKLDKLCQFEHFKDALEAGTTSLIELDVTVDYDSDDDAERLELLTNLIRGAVQLNSLTIRNNFLQNQPIMLPREFLRAMKACATVTRIRLWNIICLGVFIQDEVQKLQRITARNEELGRFVACPSTYPTENLLALMRQFKKCPTGRYMLARNLPAVFSFDKIKSADSSTMEPAEEC